MGPMIASISGHVYLLVCVCVRVPRCWRQVLCTDALLAVDCACTTWRGRAAPTLHRALTVCAECAYTHSGAGDGMDRWHPLHRPSEHQGVWPGCGWLHPLWRGEDTSS